MSIYHTDVVIIGAGPVGLFAIFECGMLGLSCHVIDAFCKHLNDCRLLLLTLTASDKPRLDFLHGLVYWTGELNH